MKTYAILNDISADFGTVKWSTTDTDEMLDRLDDIDGPELVAVVAEPMADGQRVRLSHVTIIGDPGRFFHVGPTQWEALCIDATPHEVVFVDSDKIVFARNEAGGHTGFLEPNDDGSVECCEDDTSFTLAASDRTIAAALPELA